MGRAEILSAGVDWITCTADVQAKGEELYDKGVSWLQENKRMGFKARTFQLRSWPMASAGGVAVGISDETTLLQLSGLDASCRWSEVLEMADNVSRLDLQVTGRIEDGTVDVGAKAYTLAQLAASRRGKAPKITRIQQAGEHTTTYVGSVSSEIRLRLYDKTQESRGEWPAQSWRYEVQLRDDHSQAVALRLAALAPFDATIQKAVWGYYTERGITPLYDPAETDWVDRRPVLTTDADRRLRWLTWQVRPAVEWLRLHRSEVEILSALGLAHRTTDPPS